jgi:hypothetical protein
MGNLLLVLPTLIIFGTLLGLWIWLGRNHRRTWGDAPRQEPGRPGPIIRDSTWMRGGGGGGGQG